ncbi:MFS transporter [Oceanobacillus jeddahense]|uniref:MFS transporter n=1 Tax=Oceanobacillus jeddahense TaxID=1462527 RepID=A0ABY5JWB8_9BACI|nr:MFS transporter [Oceanobacillus jeddahense]UUI04626.1 MFS transporter [Oceanobacillus jeddahense]
MSAKQGLGEKTPGFAEYLARRKIVFLVTYFGYISCYLVRNNFKLLSEELRLANDWSLTEVGFILTAFTITYGSGKFVMGMVVDQFKLNRVFAVSLAISAIAAIMMGFVESIVLMFILMLILGLAQGATAPATLSMIGAWYNNHLRGSRVAVWNTAQNLGAALLPIVIAGLLALAGPSNLAVAFWVPGLVVLVCCFFFYKYGGDRPESEGLPSLKEMYGEAGQPKANHVEGDTYWKILRQEVLTSRVLLMIALVNALLYFLRFGILNWMPAYLGGDKMFSVFQVQAAISVLEWLAIPGSLFFAWLAIKWPNKQSLVGSISMLICGSAVFFYIIVENFVGILIIVAVLGTTIYGPQLIINIMTLNFVSSRSSGAAVGFVGLAGYILGELSANFVMPIAAENFSWTVSISLIIVVAVLCILCYGSLYRAERRIVKTEEA